MQHKRKHEYFVFLSSFLDFHCVFLEFFFLGMSIAKDLIYILKYCHTHIWNLVEVGELVFTHLELT